MVNAGLGISSYQSTRGDGLWLDVAHTEYDMPETLVMLHDPDAESLRWLLRREKLGSASYASAVLNSTILDTALRNASRPSPRPKSAKADHCSR